MINIIVTRHGETKENIGKIMQGNMNTLLDEKGIEQAKELSENLKKFKIDVVISSPLDRALKTAEIAINGELPIILDDRLKSRNHGEFQGLPRTAMRNTDYWDYNKNTQYKEAESVGDLFNRVESLLNDIKQQYDNKTVLLVTHSGICRVLYYYFTGIPENGDLWGYESHNCSIEEYKL